MFPTYCGFVLNQMADVKIKIVPDHVVVFQQQRLMLNHGLKKSTWLRHCGLNNATVDPLRKPKWTAARCNRRHASRNVIPKCLRRHNTSRSDVPVTPCSLSILLLPVFPYEGSSPFIYSHGYSGRSPSLLRRVSVVVLPWSPWPFTVIDVNAKA